MASLRHPPPETPPPPPPPMELDLTIVSAKHLKNVNWRSGDLKPYCAAWIRPESRSFTRTDDTGSTRPVWNETLHLPLPPHLPLRDASLTVEVLHSRASDVPNPLVGVLRFPLRDLESDVGGGGVDRPPIVRSLELRRPSGRPQGKIRIKIALREVSLRYYGSAPAARYVDTAYSAAPAYSYGVPYYPPPSSAYSNWNYSGPSAPVVDYPTTSTGLFSAPYERQRPKGDKLGAGLAVAGAMGGLSLEEGRRYEEDRARERAETDRSVRDSYSEYRSGDY
ncbi:hypothetical protein QJS10_CPA03g01853 [Acorus calamus]|uniref:C2 domain-containing protein n=1 Tax=Acorus calamus TaxID=4465 RepID=A0AAV9F388_ACOCL|nr:hypothetical protein QJS10_CPA03g01853 [Acorus calamus]